VEDGEQLVGVSARRSRWAVTRCRGANKWAEGSVSFVLASAAQCFPPEVRTKYNYVSCRL